MKTCPACRNRPYYAAAEYRFDTDFGTVLPRIQFSYKSDVDFCFDSASCRSGLWLEESKRTSAHA
ncbi:hypothetical protein [Rhodoferax sp.]|uniref:hypothetical protein n=1 Tax=Rhodoferax sp. TaxID=50421 RepID=UPI002ACD683D|nr:hypothetical protein [Rhodoferax sp.]MDZ7921164.1 hypothetical protein [Rhodoferax sp.]